MSDYKVVVVLGNGFDLDLGLKTKYCDFVNSRFFTDNLPDKFNDSPGQLGDTYKSISNQMADCFIRIISKKNPQLRYENVNLFSYLNEESQLCSWVDIEKSLSIFATRTINVSNGKGKTKKAMAKEIEEQTFKKLHEALCSYLNALDYSGIIQSSKAMRLLQIIKGYDNLEILTFNYTDLKRLEQYVGRINVPVDNIHGRISDGNIILGFQDDLEIDDSYCFMIKSFSPHYKSHNVREKLLGADEIIIFGHSLGSTDYHYFQDLFKSQSQPEKAKKNLIMRIFTYNENSRRDILLQLRNMNDKRTDMLYDLCDFEVYRTGEKLDDSKINKYFYDLERRLDFYIRPNVVAHGFHVQ